MPSPELFDHAGKTVMVAPTELERLRKVTVRKEEPGGGDVHVNTPVWSGKKKPRRKLPKQNIRVVRKERQERGRLPFGNAEREAEFSRALRAAFAGLGSVSDDALERARRDPGAIDRALNLAAFERQLRERLVPVYIRAVRDEAEARYGDKPLAKASTALALRFDMRNPRVLAWARSRAAELVTAITEDIRKAIRAVVLRMYNEGIHPTDAIPLIRTSLGDHSLFPRWAQAVANYALRLRDQGLPDERVKEMTAAYHERLADARANMIARTEIIASQNEGRVEAWQQMVDAGYFTAAQVAKQWDASHEGACPVCDKLDGDIVDLDALFSAGVPRPPAHPNCRCVVLLVER